MAVHPPIDPSWFDQLPHTSNPEAKSKMSTEIREAIIAECNSIANMLLAKNAAYGNAIFDPMKVFSKGNWLDAVHVRIDDKLSRLARGEAAGEDVELDLIGYLILKKVGLKLMAKATQ